MKNLIAKTILPLFTAATIGLSGCGLGEKLGLDSGRKHRKFTEYVKEHGTYFEAKVFQGMRPGDLNVKGYSLEIDGKNTYVEVSSFNEPGLKDSVEVTVIRYNGKDGVTDVNSDGLDSKKTQVEGGKFSWRDHYWLGDSEGTKGFCVPNQTKTFFYGENSVQDEGMNNVYDSLRTALVKKHKKTDLMLKRSSKRLDKEMKKFLKDMPDQLIWDNSEKDNKEK